MKQTLALGDKLKALRQAQGLSQRALAQMSGLTHGNLSHIEQGKISPSVATLEKLLDALKVSLASFFAMDEPVGVVPAASWTASSTDGVHWVAMEIAQAQAGTFLVVHTLQPGVTQCRDFMRHRGLIAGCLVSGRLELNLDGNCHQLAPGDGFYFSSLRSYSLKNLAQAPTTWIGLSLLPTENQSGEKSK